MSRYSQKLAANPSNVPASVQSVHNAYEFLRRVQRMLALLVVFCAAFGFTIKHQAAALGGRSYLPVIFATTLLTFAYTIRNSTVRPALTELRRNPQNPLVLKRWRRNSLIVLGLCAAVGFIGLAMQLFGAAVPIVLVLYAIAVSYVFLLGPVRP
jgi:hypothetical protein